MVCVSVADTGPGVPPDINETLFKPFVTTKAEGMGVGLAICQSIVDAHGGKIWATPNPDGGTIFCFTVPVAGETLH
jgi:two-component system sensor kinase FixL